MTKKRSPGSGLAIADGLDVHVQEFFARLPGVGYTATTQRTKRWLVARFARWSQARRLPVSDLDEACIGTFMARRGHKPRKMERTTLEQFVEHLRTALVVSPRSTPEPSAAEALLRRYVEHLLSVRGLSIRSALVYTPFARTFVQAQRLPDTVALLSPSAVRAYLLERSKNRSDSFVKLLAASLRSFLRFLFFDSETQVDLSKAVPPVRRWRLATVPLFLTSEEVERVLAGTDRSTASGCRAHVMLLLLARLGLRAGEVAALELDDVHWDLGEIVVRGKGRRHDRLPLLDDVGEALALYLREARGPSSSRRVFLRRCAPHVGLSGPTAVCLVARSAIRHAGLLPSGRVGGHVFRHSLATRMIRCGASLAEIAQVLRHRSLDTTQLYAKVEFEALGGVALPWPTTEVPQ